MRKNRPNRDTEAAIAGGWVVESATSKGDSGDEGPAEPPMGDEPDSPERPEQFDNLSIVLFGVFGGLYLLYTWWWFVVARAYSAINAATADGSGLIGGIFQQIIFWITPFAPLTWFLTAVLISRGKKPWVLGVTLLVGAVVLIPLPMLVGGGS